jgi:signal transduction histidine kinase/CHASE3 domain sensor protein
LLSVCGLFPHPQRRGQKIAGRRLFPSSPVEWGALALTLGATLALCVNIGTFVTSHAGAARATDALFRIETLSSTLRDAESGERGFILTGNEAYLDGYEDARARLADRMTAAFATIGSDPIHRPQLLAIEDLARKKLDLLQQHIASRREAGFEAARAAVQTGESKQLMDAIRTIVLAMQDEIRQERAAEQGRELWSAFTSAVIPGGVLAALQVGLVVGGLRLRRLGEQFVKVSATVPGLVFSFRLKPDGTASMPYASPAILDLYGFGPEDVAEDATPIFARSHPDDRTHLQASIVESAGAMTEWHDEWRFNHPTKGERWIEGRSMPRAEPDGSILWHGYLHDITDRKRAEAALRQAQKLDALGQLTSGIAHDFNNYLTVIAGNLDLLERVYAGQPNAARLVSQSQAAATRAAGLVGRLLSFSRKQPMMIESLDCNEVVNGIEELLRRALPGKVELVLVIAPDLWRASTDRNQLETALLNLVVNARDALPESGGRITVRIANVTLDKAAAGSTQSVVPGDYVEIAVIDTGRGMSAEVLGHVFEPFFTTKGPGKGTGLGLSQIYGFAKQSNGHVEIDSREGVGTTVRLLLPRNIGVEAKSAASFASREERDSTTR